MAAILYRYSQFKGYNITSLSDISSYDDAGSVSDYALVPMCWANANDLITGIYTRLEPRGRATRAQVATILSRFAEKFAD